MTRQPTSIAALLTTIGTVGLTLAPISNSFANQASASTATTYTYSSNLVGPYTSGCAERLQAKGKTPAQAQTLCQCSIKQMQMQMSQSAAILMLVQAQFSPFIDPNTGLPSELSKYFASCTA